jgi:hypothetical protein
MKTEAKSYLNLAVDMSNPFELHRKAQKQEQDLKTFSCVEQQLRTV